MVLNRYQQNDSIRIDIINKQMGCFPDRNLPAYKILPNQHQRPQKRLADPNKNIDNVYVPNRADALINDKPFKRAQRQSPKKGKAEPIADGNKLQGQNKFTRQPKPSVIKMNDKQRRGSHKKIRNNLGSIDRKGGRVISSPKNQHVISQVQTPSQSAKTSILAHLQNNPSIFFVKMSQKDIDLVFNTLDKNQQKFHRLNYRSTSPRIRKQPSR